MLQHLLPRRKTPVTDVAGSQRGAWVKWLRLMQPAIRMNGTRRVPLAACLPVAIASRDFPMSLYFLIDGQMAGSLC